MAPEGQPRAGGARHTAAEPSPSQAPACPPALLGTQKPGIQSPARLSFPPPRSPLKCLLRSHTRGCPSPVCALSHCPLPQVETLLPFLSMLSTLLRKCVLTQSQYLSLRAEQKRHSMANELPRETCTCNTPYFPTCVPPRASPACPQQEADSHTGTHTRGLHSSSLTPNLVHTPLTLAIQVTVVTYVNKSQVVQRARRTPGREAVTGSR